jgi:ParB family chromosome partitioning protein
LAYLSVKAIRRNPYQPRQSFDQQGLERLAQSIKSEGLMQPIIVRPLGSGQPSVGGQLAEVGYELVAGERRLRAAQLAGLTQIPAIVRTLDNQQLAEWALIENLQREDLNPVDRAQAFEKLIKQFGFSHEQVAERIGIDRVTVSNLLRILNLCSFAVDLIRGGVMSTGQAKALAGVEDHELQKLLAERAVSQGWSVRQLEWEVKRVAAGGIGGAGGGAPPPRPPAPRPRPPEAGKIKSARMRDLEEQIGKQIGSRVRVRPKRKKGTGTLEIEFYSLDQFDALLQKLGVKME